MKRKELLQKSSTVAAVVLAAALMDPGAVQASAGDQSAAANAAQVMEQSAETGEAAAAESAETESQETSDGQAEAAESENETEETKQEAEAEPAEGAEKNTVQEEQNANTEDAAGAEETTGASENTADNSAAVTTEADSDDTDESVTTGWFQTDDGNTQYRKEDGTVYCDEFAEIDGKLYFFGWYGNLTKDTTFTKWSTVTFHDRYYKATADGSLVTNQWDESGNMYYGADGGTVAGLQTIDGKQYYFDSNCSLRRGGRLEDVEGSCYFVDDDGVLTLAENNSWSEYNGKYYYVKDGAFLRDCVEKIGDDYYGFQWDGSMYADCTFSERDDETKQDIYYRAAAGGKLITGWYTESGEKYYYGTDGKGYNGFREIDGKTYYFYFRAMLQSDGQVAQGDKTYLVGKDGSLTEAKNNDWTKVGDDYYYMKDGKLLEDCVAKIGNFYYGFDENGRMYNNEAFSIRDYDAKEWIYYQAKEGGQLAVGWYETNGRKCYYGTDGKQFRYGIMKIGNFYYGFDSNGYMYCDTNFNIWNSETQSSDYYRASADGSLTTGWYEYSGRKYYYGTDGKRYEGLQSIDGKKYYFQDGRLQSSTRIEEKGTYYIAASDGVLTEVKNNAWTKVDDKSYYMKDGAFLQSCVEKIEDSYYGFDSDGVMYDNREFSFYENGEEIYYFAQSGGELVTGWYEGDWGNTYYYGTDGKRYKGVQTINGKQYFFSMYGSLEKNSTIEIDGKGYIAGNDGVLTEAKNNAWNLIDGKYYYLKNGEFLKSCVVKIGNDYYGFDSDGVMYDDTSFSCKNAGEGSYYRYRAKAGGALYVNSWYEEYSSRYYYGEAGKGYDGIYTIDGKQYYFSNAYLETDGTVDVDGKHYVAGSDGALTEAKNNDWTKVDDSCYYLRDGEFLKGCVEKIGNFYYGFDWAGKMFNNEGFSLWDSDNSRDNWYRAKSGGALIIGWYFDGSDNYYYGEDGKAVSGLQTIDGKQYYFQSGKMCCNIAVKVDGKNYVIDNSGNLLEAKNNAWTLADGYYYYVKNGEFLEDCVEKIGNSYYGFSYQGRMYDDTSFSIRDEENRKNYEYWAKKGGALYTNSWYSDRYDSYYFGADGKGYEGYQKVNGKQYYFVSGRMYRNQLIWEELDGKHYIAGDDGVVVEAKNNTWTKVDDAYYYMKDKRFLRDCVVQIDNTWYGFNDSGRMYDNEGFAIWTRDMTASYYRAQKGGALITGWYQNRGDWYYYGTDKKGYEGLQTVNGKQYYFSQGRMCCSQTVETEKKCYIADADGNLKEAKNNEWIQAEGKYYYVKNLQFLRGCVEKIGNSYYGFNESGVMYENDTFSIWDGGKSISYRAKANGALYTSSWYQDSYQYYYYGADGKGCEGLKTINGKQYYFVDAAMCTNQAVTVNGKPYLCKNDGTAEGMKNNTWTFYNNRYYYVKNNTVLTDTVEKIGMYYYAFNSNGLMYSNQMFSMYAIDSTGKGEYKTLFAKESGALYTNSWVKYRENWYYAGADGNAYKGLKTIGGKQYFFKDGGYMSVNSVEAVYDKIYSSDENGVLTEVKGNNAWKRLHGEWYYIQNNKLLKDGIYKLGNDYYGFDSEGAVRTDQLSHGRVTDKDGNEYYAYYLADQNGKVKRNTWAKWNGAWYYFGSNGAGVNGIQKINGKTYYFAEGKMIVQSSVKADNKNYVCKADGSLAELKNNEWTLVEGKWYYVQNNSIFMKRVEKIGSSYYGFDQDGAMLKKQIFTMTDEEGVERTYFAKSDGKLAVSTWISDGTDWYYFDKSGRSVLGVQTINGKKYYFGDRGAMVTNELITSGGTRYVAKADGTLVQAANNAWTKAGGNWYYVKDGELCKSKLVQISGKSYGFDNNGIMYQNCEFGVSEQGSYVYYYASENGEIYTNKWMAADGSWMYFGKDGRNLSNCIQTINGVKYLFKWDKLGTSAYLSWNGKNYASDGDGKAYELKEKWNQVGTYWYYVKNGNVLSGTLETIGSKTYCFDYNGHMMANWKIGYAYGEEFGNGYSSYVVDEKGYVQKNQTYERWDGTYLFDANGRGVDGFRTVSGRKCYFEQGRMKKSATFQIGDVSYVAAADGTVTALSSNGWTKVDGNWYYADNGKLIQNSRFEINGKTYIFNYEGKMISEEGIWTEKGYENVVYGAAKDGTMLKNTWQKIKMYTQKEGGYSYYGWAYFDENGQALQGLQTINGKKYYFSSGLHLMVTNCLVKADDGTLYIADSNGVLKEAGQNGWTQADGKWYYTVNGVGAKDCIRRIDNAYYAFDSNGVMYTNTTFYMNDSAYHANASGKLVTNGSWKSASGDLYYFDANGVGYEGSHKVNGVTYYFEGGRLLKNAAARDKFGNMFVLDANGKQHTMKNNQWIKVGNYYYYALDGTIIKDDVVMIDGKYYGFDSDGRMFDNTTFEIGGLTYHAAAGGSLMAGKQYKSGKDTYYFDKTGVGYEGVHYIAGKRCVFSGGKIVG